MDNQVSFGLSSLKVLEDSLNVTEDSRDTDSPPIIPLEELKLSNLTTLSEKCNYYDIKDLLDSIKEGNYEEVATILGTRNVNLDEFIDYDKDAGGTVLHYAAKNGLLPIIHMLKIAEMDLDILDSEQNTPLMVAVVNMQNDAVKYLSKAGASVISKGMDGMTALHLAAKCGNLEACKVLLAAAVHIKGYKDYGDGGGWTPLVWSCEHSHVEIVKFLLMEGADPLLKDVEQNVALHWACFSGSSKIVELILNFGGEVNVVNSHGDSPLHIAARQDNINCVLLLLARGAKIKVINKLGEMPTDCCPKDSKSHEALVLNMHLQSLITVNSKPESYLSNDISKGIETLAIPCVNEIDDAHCPSDFIYIIKNLVPSITQQLIENSQPLCASNNSYFREKLSANFDYEDPPMIFECTNDCSCEYKSRVMQFGLSFNVQLFRTGLKGWGIRAAQTIPKGSFVSEYVGELITTSNADMREDDSYFFDLNCDDDGYSIDAKFYSNFSRFINHSCDPNLVPVRVFIGHSDVRFPRIGLFASREIGYFEELSFNYGDDFWIVKSKLFRCECHSHNCKYSQKTE